MESPPCFFHQYCLDTSKADLQITARKCLAAVACYVFFLLTVSKHSAWLSNDFARNVWLNSCLGFPHTHAYENDSEDLELNVVVVVVVLCRVR